MKCKAIIGCLGLYWAVSPTRAGSIGFPEGQGLLIDHQPHNFGGLASDTFFLEGATPFWQLAADDFTLPQSSPVQRLVFWAFYSNEILPAGDENIRVRFYDARPTDLLPGNVLFEESFLNVPRVWTGRNVIAAEGGKEYQFEVQLSQVFPADASTKYWLEVAQVGDISRFRWEFNALAPQNGQATMNPNYPNWHNTFPDLAANTAFQLYSIPEPMTCMLLCAEIVFRRPFKRRRSYR